MAYISNNSLQDNKTETTGQTFGVNNIPTPTTPVSADQVNDSSNIFGKLGGYLSGQNPMNGIVTPIVSPPIAQPGAGTLSYTPVAEPPSTWNSASNPIMSPPHIATPVAPPVWNSAPNPIMSPPHIATPVAAPRQQIRSWNPINNSKQFMTPHTLARNSW